jgi:hypothetical protein
VRAFLDGDLGWESCDEKKMILQIDALRFWFRDPNRIGGFPAIHDVIVGTKQTDSKAFACQFICKPQSASLRLQTE